MMQNRNRLFVDARVAKRTALREHITALAMIKDNANPAAPWARQNYDTAEFVAGCRDSRLHAVCLAERYQPLFGDRCAKQRGDGKFGHVRRSRIVCNNSAWPPIAAERAETQLRRSGPKRDSRTATNGTFI
jgi:hypothetical protein